MLTNDRWDHLFNDIPKALESDIPECFISSFRSSGIPGDLKKIRDDQSNGRWGSSGNIDPNNNSYATALTQFRNFLSSFNSAEKGNTQEIVSDLFASSYDTNVATTCDPSSTKRTLWMSFILKVEDVINNRSGV